MDIELKPVIDPIYSQQEIQKFTEELQSVLKSMDFEIDAGIITIQLDNVEKAVKEKSSEIKSAFNQIFESMKDHHFGLEKNSLDYHKKDAAHILQGSGKSYCYG